jgi:hypothetical protein
MDFITGLPKV